MAELIIDKIFKKAIDTQDFSAIAELSQKVDINELRLGADKKHPLIYLAKQAQKNEISNLFIANVIDELMDRGLDVLSREKSNSVTLASEILALQSLPTEDNEILMVHSIYRSLRQIDTDPESIIREISSIIAYDNKDIDLDSFQLSSPFKPIKEILYSIEDNLGHNTRWHEENAIGRLHEQNKWNIQSLIDVVGDHEKELGSIAYKDNFEEFQKPEYVDTQITPNHIVREKVTTKKSDDVVIKSDPAVSKMIITKMKEKYIGQDNPINQAEAMMMRDAFNSHRLAGKDVPKQSMHMRFEGPTGTGKTSMARDYAQLLEAMGRSNGTFIELTREKLLKKHIGETEENIKAFIDEAMGGVLFIDEVHNLVVEPAGSDSRRDTGLRVVEALVGAMENHRDDLTIIVAGYSGDIERFLGADSGLRDRFSRTVKFESYDEDTLSKIMDLNLSQHHLTMSDEVKKHAMAGVMEYKTKVEDRSFGNARVIRNFVEQLPDEMAYRIGSDESILKKATSEELNAVQIPDVKAYVKRLLDGVSNAKNNAKPDNVYGQTNIGFTAKLKHKP